MKRLYLFYKVCSNKVSNYILELIPPVRHSYRNHNSFTPLPRKNKYFRNFFFSCVINNWNKLDPEIRNSSSYLSFRNGLIKFIRPSECKIFNIPDQVGVKLLTRLQLGSSRLLERKFRHKFEDVLNPLCSCSIEPETTMHFFLRCQWLL